jgi:hypothetical protein
MKSAKKKREDLRYFSHYTGSVDAVLGDPEGTGRTISEQRQQE